MGVGGQHKMSNVQCAHFACNAEKARKETRYIAKTRRIANGKTQYDKRASKGGTRIKSRGFDKTRSKKMDGSVTRKER